MKQINQKIQSLSNAKKIAAKWRGINQNIVFTNGCFDIFHYGHLHLLYSSKKLGDKLIIGLNDDHSIKKIKGKNRPIHNERQRLFLLSSIIFVDLVILFSETTPIKIIQTIQPDILTKGADYSIDQVVGRNEVVESGGEVVLIPLIKNLSSSSLMTKI